MDSAKGSLCMMGENISEVTRRVSAVMCLLVSAGPRSEMEQFKM